MTVHRNGLLVGRGAMGSLSTDDCRECTGDVDSPTSESVLVGKTGELSRDMERRVGDAGSVTNGPDVLLWDPLEDCGESQRGRLSCRKSSTEGLSSSHVGDGGEEDENEFSSDDASPETSQSSSTNLEKTRFGIFSKNRLTLFFGKKNFDHGFLVTKKNENPKKDFEKKSQK